MLETLAEQPVRFDQEGVGRGHGGLSPKGLMIERRRAPRRYGAARAGLRWRDTARKIASNKDKINTLSWINGSMRAVRSAGAASAFQHRLAGRSWPLRLEGAFARKGVSVSGPVSAVFPKKRLAAGRTMSS